MRCNCQGSFIDCTGRAKSFNLEISGLKRVVALHIRAFYLDTQSPLVYTFDSYNAALAEITISKMSPLHISCKFNLNAWIQIPEAILGGAIYKNDLTNNRARR